jgi:hypothetical protein
MVMKTFELVQQEFDQALFVVTQLSPSLLFEARTSICWRISLATGPKKIPAICLNHCWTIQVGKQRKNTCYTFYHRVNISPWVAHEVVFVTLAFATIALEDPAHSAFHS